MSIEQLAETARAMVAPGKGIIAIDESSATCKKRFDGVGIECTEETRRAYRELLLTTPNANQYLSGAILFDETIRQSTKSGVPFAKYMLDNGMIPGIKVDKGTKPLPFYPGEKITEGLDGLADRLAEYKQLGARFAKWRAVIEIDENAIPSTFGIRANAQVLARYAALCQSLDLVPIVEPEVLMDGAHGIERCEVVTSAVLEAVFAELDAHRVVFEGMLLKPNMIIPGKKCPQQATAQEVADATIRCMKRYVPAAVPGVVFLSGGQSAEEATDNLNAMNALGTHPWQVSFSYGRALQAPVLAAWKGVEANAAAAQKALQKRCRLNGLARDGVYARAMEKEA